MSPAPRLRPGATRALALALPFALLLALAGACAQQGRSGGTASGGAGPAASEVSEPGAGAPAASLFELPFPLTDSEGRTRHLSDLRGRPFVAGMIYTNCTSVCPRLTADLQALERALPGPARARMRFVLFSLDPERDTPAALRRFAAEHALDTTRWTLMAAGPDDMRTLAAVLDVRFRPDGAGEIAHSAVIAVVDSAGVIRHRQTGVGKDPAPLVAAIEAAR